MSGPREDWLCDGVGEPDAFEREVADAVRGVRSEPDVEGLVARLEVSRPEETREERALSPALSRRGRERGTNRGGPPTARRWRRAAVLAAAGLVLVVGAWGVLVRGGGSAWERASGGAWRVGAWVETGSESEEFAASSVGRVTVGPGSRVRLLAAEEDEHRLELAEGSLEALIYAPPRLFFVETPGATAVDMGCAYELDVAEDGSGLLRVTGGWVELEAKDGSGMASRVPAGAVCEIGADGAPGVPRFEDSEPAFVSALEQLQSGDAAALATVLAAARVRDSLTLWHLVWRLEGDDRASVIERLAGLVPAEGVGEGARSLEASAMEAWWSAIRRAW